MEPSPDYGGDEQLEAEPSVALPAAAPSRETGDTVLPGGGAEVEARSRTDPGGKVPPGEVVEEDGKLDKSEGPWIPTRVRAALEKSKNESAL